MPNYDFKCESCENVTERFVPFEDRKRPCKCPDCGGKALYQFPVTATFQPFEPYYDEALGLDVHGRREKKEALRAFGLIETGDAVNGARDVETSPHAVLVKPQAAKGITLSDIQRQETLNRMAMESFQIGVVEKKTGKTIMPKKKLTEVPSV